MEAFQRVPELGFRKNFLFWRKKKSKFLFAKTTPFEADRTVGPFDTVGKPRQPGAEKCRSHIA